MTSAFSHQNSVSLCPTSFCTPRPNLPANAGDWGLIPGSGRSPGGGHGNPLQHSCLGNPMGRGHWQAIIHRVAKSRTRLSNFTFTFNLHALEKEMATHSSVFSGESQGRRRLVGCHLWGRTELDRSEMTQQQQHRASPSLAAKNIINLISVLTIW